MSSRPSRRRTGTLLTAKCYCRVLLASVIASSCGAHLGTQRRVNGQLTMGRTIEPIAYALFAQGSTLEQQGKLQQAEDYYRRALDSDPNSAALWARMGHLRCSKGLGESRLAFDRAESIAPQYAPTQILRSQCLELHGQWEQALRRAEQAVSLAPASWIATRQWAKLLQRTQQDEAAGRVTLGYALLYPERGQQPTISDRALLHYAPPSSEWTPPLTAAEQAPPVPVLSGVLDALGKGQLSLAQQLVEPLVNSSPQDSDRLLVALSVAHQLQDSVWFEKLLRDTEASTIPSAAQAKKHEQLLRQLVNDSASTAWARAYHKQSLREHPAPSR